jgi:hypothetical protein
MPSTLSRKAWSAEHVDLAAASFDGRLGAGVDRGAVGQLQFQELDGGAVGHLDGLAGAGLVDVAQQHARALLGQHEHVARPMPEAPPVIITVLYLSCMGPLRNVWWPSAPG